MSGSFEPSMMQTPRRRDSGRLRTAQFAPRLVSIQDGTAKVRERSCERRKSPPDSKARTSSCEYLEPVTDGFRMVGSDRPAPVTENASSRTPRSGLDWRYIPRNRCQKSAINYPRQPWQERARRRRHAKLSSQRAAQPFAWQRLCTSS